jgi:hypothetical protein
MTDVGDDVVFVGPKTPEPGAVFKFHRVSPRIEKPVATEGKLEIRPVPADRKMNSVMLDMATGGKAVRFLPEFGKRP